MTTPTRPTDDLYGDHTNGVDPVTLLPRPYDSSRKTTWNAQELNAIYATIVGGTASCISKNFFVNGLSGLLEVITAEGDFAGRQIAISGVVGAGGSKPWPDGGCDGFYFWAHRAAFRVGSASGTEWDTANVGNLSVVLGKSCLASGENAIAIGQNISATHSQVCIIAPGDFTAASLEDKSVSIFTGALPAIHVTQNPLGDDIGLVGIGLGAVIPSASWLHLGASTASFASLCLPHGAAPSSNYVNGQMWTTTAGVFARINGANVGPFVDASGAAPAFSAVTGGTNVAALVIGTGGSLGRSGSGTISASDLLGSTWAQPAAIGNTTCAAGTFTNLAGGTNSFYVNNANGHSYVWNGARLVWCATGTALADNGDVALSRAEAGVLGVYTAKSGTTLAQLLHKGVYAGIYENGAGSTITVTTAGTYYGWTTATAGSVVGAPFMTADTTQATGDRLVCGASGAGVYKVNLACSFSGSNNAVIECAVHKNGAELTNVEFKRKLNSTGDIGSASACGLVTLAANDYLDVRFTSGTNGDSVTVRVVNLVAVRIGG